MHNRLIVMFLVSVGENVGDAKFYIKNGGLSNIYSTQQIHFHWGSRNNQGSEHTVNGKSSPLEVTEITRNMFKNKYL